MEGIFLGSKGTWSADLPRDLGEKKEGRRRLDEKGKVVEDERKKEEKGENER